VGVVPLRRSDLLADLLKTTRLSDRKICTRAELVRRVEGRRQAGQSIVFTNGCFDLLHVGHLAYLRQAADEGNCLIVAINSDESVRRLGKAADRPLFDQNYRAEMLAGLEAVDFVVVFDEDTPHAILNEIRPDVLVKGGTYTEEEIVGREVVLEYGGRVKPLGVRPGVSTTDIVARLRRAGAPSSIPLSAYVPERRAG
jgi:D-beta-D-heptose 7-phosphate kinase/D-beta-D-heptose 1-phosphate adenosyltransferase